MEYVPPHFSDAAVRDAVREILGSVGYRDREIRGRLGAQEAVSVRALGRAVLEGRVDHVGGRLGVLLRLFLLCRQMPVDEAEAALGLDAVNALRASGLVASVRGPLRPTVQLSTVEDLVIAADLPARHAAAAADFVLAPFGITLTLAGFTVPRPVESVLDLGCGGGTLAALAASRAQRVVATDVNARAVAFSRFNAELNGLDNMECREGSLFEPVCGERFDLIVCNPPYVISPADTFMYRDGGTQICRDIVREAPEFLTGVGYLQMMVEWPQRADEDWRAEVSRWLDDGKCDAWLLRLYSSDAEQYTEMQLLQEYKDRGSPPEARKLWMDHLAALEVDSVGGGILTVRRARGGAPIRTIRDAPPVSRGAVGGSLERWILAQSLLASVTDHSELLDIGLVPAPELERTERKAPTGEGWTRRTSQLRLREGLRFGADVDPVAEEIVGLLDGRRTPREALEVFAAQHGISTEPFQAGLPKALAKLLELGLVVPTDSLT